MLFKQKILIFHAQKSLVSTQNMTVQDELMLQYIYIDLYFLLQND